MKDCIYSRRGRIELKGMIRFFIMLMVISFGMLLGGMAEARNIPVEYYQNIDDVGMVEKRYRPQGYHEVASKIILRGEKAYGNYTYKVWYPKNIEDSGRTFPLVLFLNGTGNTYGTDEPLYEHLASWGFIVLGNNDASSGRGGSADYGMEIILKENENPSSFLYGRVWTDRIGIVGFSQGGVGAVNAVSEGKYGNRYKAMATISAVTKSLVNNLHPNKWDYDVSGIHIPYLMVSGTGPIDRKIICPLAEMEGNVRNIDANVPVVLARRGDADHPDIQERADAYVTAWFRYLLWGDFYAGQAFIGEDPEIEGNPRWENVYRRALP